MYKIISPKEIVDNFDEDQYITLQNLVDTATKHNIDFTKCKIMSLNIPQELIDNGSILVTEQNTGDLHEIELYNSLNEIVVIDNNIYLTI
jgi:hypothetical protein